MFRFLANLRTTSQQRSAARSYQRDWDRARREAVSSGHRAEIDAIFTRHEAS